MTPAAACTPSAPGRWPVSQGLTFASNTNASQFTFRTRHGFQATASTGFETHTHTLNKVRAFSLHVGSGWWSFGGQSPATRTCCSRPQLGALSQNLLQTDGITLQELRPRGPRLSARVVTAPFWLGPRSASVPPASARCKRVVSRLGRRIEPTRGHTVLFPSGKNHSVNSLGDRRRLPCLPPRPASAPRCSGSRREGAAPAGARAPP